MGSSPLARGPRWGCAAGGVLPGLIPARAGTTDYPFPSPACFGAHPRSRGDHAISSRAPRTRLGSSPLARGPQERGVGRWCVGGLIPARAGTTEDKYTVYSCSWAHPRSRGDHVSMPGFSMPSLGSSPLARGPRGPFVIPRGVYGLIPARAGTTQHFPSLRPGSRAHPRSRGDHRSVQNCRSRLRGSSPLARGPQRIDANFPGFMGLIPARAGTTGGPQFFADYWWAHPRSRGDHATLKATFWVSWGSSPLARGPLNTIPHGGNDVGLIPARAGTTRPP